MKSVLLEADWLATIFSLKNLQAKHYCIPTAFPKAQFIIVQAKLLMSASVCDSAYEIYINYWSITLLDCFELNI